MEPRSDRKERRFRIEKLEERIAPVGAVGIGPPNPTPTSPPAAPPVDPPGLDPLVEPPGLEMLNPS